METRVPRVEVVKRLGPLGDLVYDVASKIEYPVHNAPSLARQMTDGGELVVGGGRFPLPQMALQLPQEFFPLTSFNDLIDKLEQANLRDVRPADVRKLLDRQPLIGFSLRQPESELRAKSALHPRVQMGGPEMEPKPLAKPPRIVDQQREATRFRERLGPLGDLILSLSGRLVFPIAGPVELAQQFTEDDRLHVGSDEYLLPEAALLVPEELFPISSLKDLVAKLEGAGIAKIRPEELHPMFAQQAKVGVVLARDEHFLQRRASRFEMHFGDPGTRPQPAKQPTEVKDPDPERTGYRDRLGPLGDIVLEVADMVTFPVLGPAELASNFSPEEVLFLGASRFPLAQLALRLPEEVFPLTSLDDLVTKVESAGLREMPMGEVRRLLDEPLLGITVPHDERELRSMARNSELEMGGPDTLPSAAPRE